MTKSHKVRGGKSHSGHGQGQGQGRGQAGDGQVGQGQADSRQAASPKPLAGGVLHDDRGNAVWHWASETARNAAVSTSALLKRLNVSSLSLDETRDEERRQAAAWASYSATATPGKPAAGKPAAAKPAPGKPPIRSSWWRRLFQRR